MIATVPVAPLLEEAERRGMSLLELARVAGVSARAVMRWKSAGRLQWFYADAAAIRLGHHPSLLWPREWEALDA